MRLIASVLGAMPACAFATGYPEHYLYDPAYDGGVALDDAFASSSNQPHYAEQVANLGDGSVVAVGLVPASGSTVANNIGLVHYDASGNRTGWPNPTATYASYFNIYITYPNFSTSWVHIADVKVFNNTIYVLADYASSTTDHDVHVVAFGVDGHFIGDTPVNDTSSYEFGAALVPYSYGPTQRRLIVVANYKEGSQYVTTLTRFVVNISGALTTDALFGNGGSIDQPIPASECPNGTAPCSGAAQHVAAVFTDTNAPRLYILGTLAAVGGSAVDSFVMEVDGSTGNLAAGPNFLTIPNTNFDISFGANNAQGPALGIVVSASTSDYLDNLIYATVVRQDATTCYTQAAIIRKFYSYLRVGFINPVTGIDTTWGTSGDAFVCNNDYGYAFFAKAVVSDGTNIAVSGVDSKGNPEFATVSQASGELLSFDVVPWLRANGTRWDGGTNEGNYQDAGFVGIVPNGSGVFTVTGTICDSTRAACPLFGTTRLAADEIFGNGFESP
jgi:hypothetical protein